MNIPNISVWSSGIHDIRFKVRYYILSLEYMWSDGVLVGFFRTSGMGWWCNSIGIFWTSRVGWWYCSIGIFWTSGVRWCWSIGIFWTSGVGWWCWSIDIFWTSGVGWWCYGIGHLKGISFDHNTNDKGDIQCVHHSDTWYRMYNIVLNVQSIICKASRWY